MRARRLLDAMLASLGVAVFAPAVAVLALAIELEDGGPVFFRQERVGRGRQRFVVLKLRSMRGGRVTRVGRLLRGTGIDETAQFLCVLRGDMRMVGPRPLTPEDVGRLGWDDPALDWRFQVAPGITGLAQLFAVPGATSSLAMDRAYVDDSSATLDLFVVAASFACNLFGKRRVKRWLSRCRYGRLAAEGAGCDLAHHGARAGCR